MDFGSDRESKKNASGQSTCKYRDVSSDIKEGTTSEKTRLKKVTYLLSKSEQNASKNVVLQTVTEFFMNSFIASKYTYRGIKSYRIQLCHYFLAVLLLSQDILRAQISSNTVLDCHS